MEELARLKVDCVCVCVNFAVVKPVCQSLYTGDPTVGMTFEVGTHIPEDDVRRGGNLSNSCTQFPLETVIQLLKEAGVVLAADAGASASGKPSEAAVPDADNLDLANMPATFDYEGVETSWQQGLPPGEV